MQDQDGHRSVTVSWLLSLRGDWSSRAQCWFKTEPTPPGQSAQKMKTEERKLCANNPLKNLRNRHSSAVCCWLNLLHSKISNRAGDKECAEVQGEEPVHTSCWEGEPSPQLLQQSATAPRPNLSLRKSCIADSPLLNAPSLECCTQGDKLLRYQKCANNQFVIQSKSGWVLIRPAEQSEGFQK